MNLYYYVNNTKNFGDDMNEWFWDEFLPGFRYIENETTLFGIGTILNESLMSQHSRVLVCGSGAGYGKPITVDPKRIEFSWVRGPKTALRLNIDPSIAITDPACMVTKMQRFNKAERSNSGTIFIPHRSTAQLNLNWSRLGTKAGLNIVLPTGEATEVISKIASAELVITESLHGAIFADAFRIPWVALSISNEFNDFKWQDWSSSVDVSLEVHQALAVLHKSWRTLNNIKGWLKSSGNKLKSKSIIQSSSAKIESSTDFDLLDESGNQRIKSLISQYSIVFEHLLAQDLKKAKQRRPQLSQNNVINDRIQKIEDRLGILNRRINEN